MTDRALMGEEAASFCVRFISTMRNGCADLEDDYIIDLLKTVLNLEHEMNVSKMNAEVLIATHDSEPEEGSDY